jgi:hypothetical protein
MQTTRTWVTFKNSPMTSFKLAMALFLFLLTSGFAFAQDSPGRFEIGGGFTAVRFSIIGGAPASIGGGVFFNSAPTFGPEVSGDFNFNRHFALDGAFSWLPADPEHLQTGLFGLKAGARTQHFGFFGKVRPGFMHLGDVVRDQTIAFDPNVPGLTNTLRRTGLTQPILDVGGVLEYYPARHWALRWDMGDTIAFEEKGTTLTEAIVGSPTVTVQTPAATTNNFQFSTSVHYRF